MVSALDSGSSVMGYTLGQHTDFSYIVPFPTELYKWVQANLMLGWGLGGGGGGRETN